MTSSSDDNMSGDNWKQMDVGSLEKHEFKEMITRDDSEPDRRQLFELLIKAKEELPQDAFRPLIKEAGGKPPVEPVEEEPPVEEELPVEPEPEPEPVIDVKEIEERAFRAGFTKGEEEGYAAGVSKGNELVEYLGTLVGDIENAWGGFVKNNEEKIISLVCRIAEKVVAGHVDVNNEIVKNSILHSLETIPEPESVTISVNPEDYEFIEVVKEDFFDTVRGLQQVSVISDSSVNRGGCKIETQSGEVDTDIESRLELVKNSVIQSLKLK